MQAKKPFGLNKRITGSMAVEERPPLRSNNARRISAMLQPHRSTPLTREQFAALISAVENKHGARDVKDVLTIVYHTGMRVRELAELRWKDVNLQERHFVVTSGKNTHTRRVPFGSKVFRVLEERKERNPNSDFVMGKLPQSVLRSVSYQLMSLSRGMRKGSIRLYDLRRTFMARWVSAGGSTAQLSLITGCSLFPRDLKVISFEHLHKSAAKFQARLEEEAQEVPTQMDEP